MSEKSPALFLELAPRQTAPLGTRLEAAERYSSSAPHMRSCVVSESSPAPGAFQAAQELESMWRYGDLIRMDDTYQVLDKKILKLRPALSGSGKECAS